MPGPAATLKIELIVREHVAAATAALTSRAAGGRVMAEQIA